MDDTPIRPRSSLQKAAILSLLLTMVGCSHAPSSSEAPDNAAFMQRLHALSNEQINLRVNAYRIKANPRVEGRFLTEFPTLVAGTPGTRSVMMHTETLPLLLRKLSAGGHISLAAQSSTTPVPGETVTLPLYPPRSGATAIMQPVTTPGPMLLITSGITSCGDVEMAYAMVRLPTPQDSVDKVDAGGRLVQAPGTDISYGKDFIASGSILVISYTEPGSLDHLVLTMSPSVAMGMSTTPGAPLTNRYEK